MKKGPKELVPQKPAPTFKCDRCKATLLLSERHKDSYSDPTSRCQDTRACARRQRKR